MTEKALIVVDYDELPGATQAPSGVGFVALTTITGLIDNVHRVYKSADDLEGSPDTIESLRADINALSDSLRLLAGEVYQIGRGIEAGRICASHSD
ncbi:hypothetical protein [Agromyces arachidis]|uniref:hypothetical protein n=1 Tax=Agromyces arachidis TaxID=766966 RepID=UPI004056EBA9